MNYRLEIKNTDMELYMLKQRRAELVEWWVDEDHPLKVGDIVKANGFSYWGKEMQVEELGVELDSTGRNWMWTAIGRVLNKDGNPGKNRGEWRADAK